MNGIEVYPLYCMQITIIQYFVQYICYDFFHHFQTKHHISHFRPNNALTLF